MQGSGILVIAIIFGVTKVFEFIKTEKVFLGSIDRAIPAINKMEEEHQKEKRKLYRKNIKYTISNES